MAELKVAIMQPYFMPYLGYWQLMNAVDKFVVYDDIEFTKKGWIHRNRILQNGKDLLFSLPLKKDSDYLSVKERFLAGSSEREIDKLLRKVEAAYKKAPYFEDVFGLVQRCFRSEKDGLFDFIYASILEIANYLEITTEIIISSDLEYNSSLKSQDKVLDICKVIGADVYINPIGGQGLYSVASFLKEDVDLKFHRMDNVRYEQFENDFVPSLSIIDVLMFNSVEDVKLLLDKYALV